nr:trigger factor [Desulfobacterales bacterium]
QKIDEIKAFYRQDPDRFEMFKQTLLEKKAIKLIIENSAIKDVKPEKISKKSDKISEPKK